MVIAHSHDLHGKFARATHCKRGHELSPDNLYVIIRKDTGRTDRSCLICRNENLKRARAKRPKGYWKRYVDTRRIWERKHKNGISNPTSEVRVGICELGACKDPLATKRLCYDHDHATGAHRGWLCVYCNTMLGSYEKHKALCEAYLERKKG